MGDGEGRGRDGAQAAWLFDKIEGVSGKGRRPAAPQLQTREKQKGFQEGPALDVGSQEGFPEAGKPGHGWECPGTPLLGWRRAGSEEVQEEQFITKNFGEVPQNRSQKPGAGVLD